MRSRRRGPAGGTRAWSLVKGWHLHVVVPALVALCLLLRFLPSSYAAPQLRSALPVLSPTSASVALLLSLIIIAAFDEPAPALQRLTTGARRYAPQLRVATLTLLATALLASAGAANGVTALLALTAEGLVVATVTGTRLCWPVPLAHALAGSMLGANAFGELASWAWFLRADVAPGGLLASTALYVVSLAATIRWGVRDLG